MSVSEKKNKILHQWAKSLVIFAGISSLYACAEIPARTELKVRVNTGATKRADPAIVKAYTDQINAPNKANDNKIIPPATELEAYVSVMTSACKRAADEIGMFRQLCARYLSSFYKTNKNNEELSSDYAAFMKKGAEITAAGGDWNCYLRGGIICAPARAKTETGVVLTQELKAEKETPSYIAKNSNKRKLPQRIEFGKQSAKIQTPNVKTAILESELPPANSNDANFEAEKVLYAARFAAPPPVQANLPEIPPLKVLSTVYGDGAKIVPNRFSTFVPARTAEKLCFPETKAVEPGIQKIKKLLFTTTALAATVGTGTAVKVGFSAICTSFGLAALAATMPVWAWAIVVPVAGAVVAATAGALAAGVRSHFFEPKSSAQSSYPPPDMDIGAAPRARAFVRNEKRKTLRKAMLKGAMIGAVGGAAAMLPVNVATVTGAVVGGMRGWKKVSASTYKKSWWKKGLVVLGYTMAGSAAGAALSGVATVVSSHFFPQADINVASSVNDHIASPDAVSLASVHNPVDLTQQPVDIAPLHVEVPPAATVWHAPAVNNDGIYAEHNYAPVDNLNTDTQFGPLQDHLVQVKAPAHPFEAVTETTADSFLPPHSDVAATGLSADEIDKIKQEIHQCKEASAELFKHKDQKSLEEAYRLLEEGLQKAKDANIHSLDVEKLNADAAYAEFNGKGTVKNVAAAYQHALKAGDTVNGYGHRLIELVRSSRLLSAAALST